MFRNLLPALVSLALVALGAAPDALAQKSRKFAMRADLYVSAVYDATRDPQADINLAIAKAAPTHRYILLNVGGEWCVWCHILDDYLAKNQQVGDAFAASFVMVKVNWEPKNRNEAFLSKYPKITGYPHFLVLDSSGKFLASQDTAPLERGESYNKSKMLDFAKRWATK